MPGLLQVNELGQQAAQVVTVEEGEVHLLGPVFGHQAQAALCRCRDGGVQAYLR